MILALAGATTWYSRSAWFVDAGDDEVVIMQGRPGGVLWFDPTVVERTGVELGSLDGASQDRVRDQLVFGSLEEARELVDNLEPAEDQVAIDGDDGAEAGTAAGEDGSTATTVPGSSTTSTTSG